MGLWQLDMLSYRGGQTMSRYCKQCKFLIIPSSLHQEDLTAQSKGFCCHTCGLLYRDEMEYILEKEIKNAL